MSKNSGICYTRTCLLQEIHVPACHRWHNCVCCGRCLTLDSVPRNVSFPPNDSEGPPISRGLHGRAVRSDEERLRLIMWLIDDHRTHNSCTLKLIFIDTWQNSGKWCFRPELVHLLRWNDQWLLKHAVCAVFQEVLRSLSKKMKKQRSFLMSNIMVKKQRLKHKHWTNSCNNNYEMAWKTCILERLGTVHKYSITFSKHWSHKSRVGRFFLYDFEQ